MTVIPARKERPTGWRVLLKSKDASLAITVLFTVALLVLPMPALALDILIVLNLASSIGIILISMYIRKPMDFSVFPSVLLLVTLFRLGLNVATSRSILLNASAGKVVATFGAFVVGGNYVVGVVIFLTLLIIQFVVITSGAGRVAEVAARFTLDAMPGKQLSIDADLNAGIINDSEARVRRRLVEIEADFYGAMDGASKFVRGDAIAAIAIVVINIFGGFVIGIWQLQMGLLEALQTYTLLTVGAGLVVQIPALLISTAAGLIVTRAASDESLGGDLISQLGNTSALGVASGVIVVLAFVPGMPLFPFLAVGLAMGGTTYALWQRQQTMDALPEPKAEPPAITGPEDVSDLLTVDALGLEIGYGLIALVGEEQAENLLQHITGIRRQLATELGLLMLSGFQ